MKLVYNQYETPILNGSFFNLLFIESATEFYKFQYHLQLHFLGEGEIFCLSEPGKILPMDKNCDWITSPWNLDLNSRKLINNLYSYLSETLRENNLDTDIINKWIEIEEVLESVFYDEESVVYNKEIIGLSQIFKFFDVRLNDDINL